ncbi:homoserine O-succinyltransferase MetX [Candidatus Palauibacter sp.]|uniref:homoserine O-succinyltransferase MetX n=1 Tax=Candidatus Palauibacter sp. TaxID=3101350 RepID=UPI003B52D392
MANRSSARVASHAAFASHAALARIQSDPTTNVRAGVVRATIPFDHLGARSVSIAYEAQGPAGAPTTVVLGGISAGRHLAPTASDPSSGWWPGVVGEGAALDPARHLLVGIDYLGGNSEEGLLRPVTSHDQARAIAAVLDELGIAAASFAGASYGGMVALAFAELFPTRVARLVILCAAHRTHPMATAVRSVQRSAAELGAATGQAARGLALARALAMTTYRSAREFEERFETGPLNVGEPGQSPSCFPVEQYLNARGADFTRRFDTERFLALSESIDLHATAPASLPPPTLLVSFNTDVLVPPWLVDELAARSGRCPKHITAPSTFGHDAFLKEVDAVATLLEAGNPEVVR